MEKFINVYAVTREFGGYEEGGWWYDHHECIHTEVCSNDEVSEKVERLNEEYQSLAYGDIQSVRGGVEIWVYVEDSIAESATHEKPMYE